MFPTEKPIEVALLEKYFIFLAKQPTRLKCLLVWSIFLFWNNTHKCCESMQIKLSRVTVSPKKLQKSKGTAKISTICQSSWLGDWSYIEVGAVVYAWIYTVYTVKANVFLLKKSLIQYAMYHWTSCSVRQQTVFLLGNTRNSHEFWEKCRMKFVNEKNKHLPVLIQMIATSRWELNLQKEIMQLI